MKKVTGVIFATLILALVGCDDKNAAKPSGLEGNFTAKQETLSSNNKADIKADLTALNAIINASNSSALKMREELLKAAKNKDQAALKKIIESTTGSIQKTNEQLMGLTINSKEIQDLRAKIVAGNQTAAQLVELTKKGSKLSEQERKEMALLQKQSMAMQAEYGPLLDKLNKEYKN